MNIGGAGFYLLNLLRSHDRNKFVLSIALPRGSMLKERLAPLGVHIYEFDSLISKSFELSAIKILSQLIRIVDPDIVHTHAALSGRIAGKRCGKYVVYTRHSGFSPNPLFKTNPGKMVFKLISERYADRIIAVSENCRDDLISCGISAARIDVILNGSPPVHRINEEQRAALRMENGYTPDENLVGIIARVEPYKGHMLLLEAAKILKDEGRKLKFIVAGTGSCEADVKNRANALGLSDMVVFPGFVKDVASLLNMLDLQINASYVEATSMSLIEGMSIGLPAVASDAGGNPGVIKDCVNGLLFKSRDSASLAACIARFFDSPKLLEKLSEGALDVYNSFFTCERFARNTEATYMKILEASANGE
jgi:glycosyltransferase involved in cell wall biosynthesis